ncbi:TM2 protein [Novosphingobium sp. Rr 2-17]|uniref:TM2 domain-containing protein n=1 Tax=Novosphingobium sp. Rr 2-17 TaxID=555793 RepID=UPI0002699B4B|nr:TM2 domain-containing protein [Novosphingobium sp. Rr 2-17]EIZ81079.1 TM2 protein [Novosphingobium sp. Rr 2-17]
MNDDLRAQLRYDAQRKSPVIAYILWFFVGFLGAHRFYLGTTGAAVAQLLLGLLGWLPFFVGWGILGVWLFIDLFLIPGIAERKNYQLAERLTF